MYGDEHKPCLEENKVFSKDAAKLGWKYFYNGDPDTAMKRFNQAWMFDRKNPEAFWGFGVIMGQRATQSDPEKNLRESIHFLGMPEIWTKKTAASSATLPFPIPALATSSPPKTRTEKRNLPPRKNSSSRLTPWMLNIRPSP